MSAYEVAKLVHVTCVALSATGFVVRGLLMLSGSPRLDARAVRVLPHIVDTSLLGAAVAMLVIARLDPRDAPWIMAKIAGLLAYILLGAVALRHGRTRAVRVIALAGALAALAYIVTVAFTRSPLGPL